MCMYVDGMVMVSLAARCLGADIEVIMVRRGGSEHSEDAVAGMTRLGKLELCEDGRGEREL